MRRLALLLACLALTACAPAVYVTPPAIGPAELQRYSDAATNTAVAQAAQATLDARQAAHATATGLSARETSTAARLGTLDALAGQQTESALSLTAAAGAGLATDAAAVRTQSARQTQVWATPTVAAIRTQAAATADELRRQQASANSAAQFWSLLRWVILASIAGLVIVACVLILVRGLAYIIAEAMREKAAIAREAFKVLAPGHWAEWTPGYGYNVYQLPGALDEPATIIENAVTTPSRVHAWRQAVRLFAWWGERYGFGINELGAGGAGVVSDPTWRAFSKLLKDAGALAELPKAGQRGRVTQWAPGWDYRRFADELGSGRLAPPFPVDADPPKVAFTVPNITSN